MDPFKGSHSRSNHWVCTEMDIMGVSIVLLALSMANFVKILGSLETASIHIVHMDNAAMPKEFINHVQWYKSLLSSVKKLNGEQKIEEDSFIYTYDTVMHGFSAMLTQSQLDLLEEMPGHISSFPDSLGTMDTTHSTEFLGLSPDKGILPASQFGQDIIVGVLDTGIWPESQSFKDDGMGPVPAKWKGTCENSTTFLSSLCNRKLVGARHFNKALVAKYGNHSVAKNYDSARDWNGHGSHTSSTAGGNYVKNVDFYGYAGGTARGVAPRGRVAMYKVTWSIGAMASDVLAAMESAIGDGVDVLSMSFGYHSTAYFQDAIAIGAFAALKSGVVVVCSAGNTGPERGIMHNGAPWILTVGASTIDRDFTAALKLGDGSVRKGSCFYTNPNRNESYHISETKLVYQSGDPACQRPLDAATVKGTVVLCANRSSLLRDALKSAGARALVSVAQGASYEQFPDDFPMVVMKSDDGAALVKYASSSSTPVVEIQLGITSLGVMPAPSMASFSSRGPYPPSQNIMKPDVTAPGVDILAAWLPNKTEPGNYVMISGTSMSCPHVAGLAVLMKAVHPDWSPAAIKSAIMTTSYTLSNSKEAIIDLGYYGVPATPLDMGAGHVDPDKAIDPGLVYDITAEDYVNYLCTLNYTEAEIQSITGTSPGSCSTGLHLGSDGLNYPSFTAIFKNNSTSSFSSTFQRTLTNVGGDISSYHAEIEVPKGLKVQVVPDVVQFKKKFEKVNFTLVLEVEGGMGEEYVLYGYLRWVEKNAHVVQSPVLAVF